jgi:hypothetical protein
VLLVVAVGLDLEVRRTYVYNPHSLRSGWVLPLGEVR